MSAIYTPSGGPRMTKFLERIPVESQWLAGHHITWTTGQQDRADGLGPEKASHCSAFVAAVALALDLYVLRPPDHKQELLTNAQYDWLNGPDAKASGWQSLGLSGVNGVLAQAVALANAGQLVLAAFKSANQHKPGHICILRPQEKLVGRFTAGRHVRRG